MYSKNAIWKRTAKVDPRMRVILGRMPSEYMTLMNELHLSIQKEPIEEVQVIDGLCSVKEFYATGKAHRYDGSQYTRICVNYEPTLMLEPGLAAGILGQIEQRYGHFETANISENVIRIDFPE